MNTHRSLSGYVTSEEEVGRQEWSENVISDKLATARSNYAKFYEVPVRAPCDMMLEKKLSVDCEENYEFEHVGMI